MSNLINTEMEERITDEVYNDDSLGMKQILLAVKHLLHPTLSINYGLQQAVFCLSCSSVFSQE